MNTCIGCKYYDQCGDNERTEPCNGKQSNCNSCRFYEERFEIDDYSGEMFDVSWCSYHEIPIDDVSDRTCEDYSDMPE